MKSMKSVAYHDATRYNHRMQTEKENKELHVHDPHVGKEKSRKNSQFELIDLSS